LACMSLFRKIIATITVFSLAILLGLLSSWLARQIWLPSTLSHQNGLAAKRVSVPKSDVAKNDYLHIKPPLIDQITLDAGGAYRLAGIIQVYLPGPHRVGLRTNAGFKIYINGKLALTNMADGPTGPHSGHMWLGSGRHILEMEIATENQDQTAIELSWSTPRRSLGQLDASLIYPAPSLLTASTGPMLSDRADRTYALCLWIIIILGTWLLSRIWLRKGWWRRANLRPIFKRDHIVILLLVLFSMFLSANYAWFNPRPGYNPELRLSDSVPIWWQYDMDAPMELYTAADFPYFFKEMNTRINRPLYPVLVWAASGLVYVAARPFGEIGLLGRSIPAYFLIKLLIMLTFGIFGFYLMREFIGDIPSLAAIGLMLSLPYAIKSLATIHTYELQFVTPVLIAWFLLLLSRDYRHSRNIIFSLIIGLMLLGRPNYSSFFAALIFGLLHRRYKESLLSLVCAFIPLGAWLLFIKLASLQYTFASVQAYGNLSWFGHVLAHDHVLLLLQDLFSRIWAYSAFLLGNPWGVVAAFSLCFYVFNRKQGDPFTTNQILLFLCLSILVNFAQYLAVGAQYTRMAIDLWFWVFAFAAYGLVRGLGGESKKRQALIMACVLLFSYSYSVVTTINLPWVHPHLQIH
jgi:hypothetical protein